MLTNLRSVQLLLLVFVILLAACGADETPVADSDADDESSGDAAADIDNGADSDDEANQSDEGSAPGGEPFKIGVLIALTGAAAPYGEEEARAIQAVADRKNAEGGIDGRPIELIIRDTKTDPTEAARLANQVILDDGVIAIIGATTGSETHTFLELALQEEVPVFPMVGTQSVTDPDEEFSRWVFRMSVPISVDLPASRNRIVEDGYTRAAVFYEEDAYGEQGSEMFESLSNEAGDIEVTANVSAPKDATDLTAVATRIRNSDPEVVYMHTASPNSAGAFLRALRDVGLEVPVYGVAGIVQTAVIDAGGEGAESLIAPALVNPNSPGPLTALFEIMEDNGGVSGFGALLGANAMAGVIAGLESGATDGASLRDAMETIGPIEGFASGPIEYSPDDHEGWGPETLFFVTIANGEFVNLDD